MIKRERCSHYLARGALLWGPLYTTIVSSMVYAAAPVLSGEATSYSEVLRHSALICPSLGAAGGYIRWRLSGKGTESREAGSEKTRRRSFLRLRTGRKTSHRKAA